MDILREILRVVTSKSDTRKTFPELHDDNSENLLTAKYIRGVLENQYETDDQAAKDLYGSGRIDQRYRTLKSRLQERLLHSLLFLQVKQPEHSEILSYYYKCTRNLIAAQTLMRFASRKASTYIAERTLVVAQKYQFTDLCLQLVALLRESAGIRFSRKEFLHYNQLLKEYLEILEAEYASEEGLDYVVIESKIASRKKSYLLDLSKGYMDRIDASMAKHASHKLILNKYRMAVNVSEISGEHERSIEICNEALAYLFSNPHLIQKARIGEFTSTKMFSCVYLRRFRDALDVADTCIGSFIEAGTNWYVALDVSFVSAINCGEYDIALDYYWKAVSHKRFALQPEHTRERWVVYGAYLNLAERLGLFRFKEESQRTTFRLSTFMNSVPVFSKEKKIENILILISHTAFLIIDNAYDSAERRLEYLRVYTTRYLREKEYMRTRLFLRLIASFPRLSFDAKAIASANAKLAKLLEESSAEPMPSETNELIPYEVLYKQLLRVLEQNEQGV